MIISKFCIEGFLEEVLHTNFFFFIKKGINSLKNSPIILKVTILADKCTKSHQQFTHVYLLIFFRTNRRICYFRCTLAPGNYKVRVITNYKYLF